VDAFDIFISLDHLVVGQELDWNGAAAVGGVVDVVENLRSVERVDGFFGVDE